MVTEIVYGDVTIPVEESQVTAFFVVSAADTLFAFTESLFDGKAFATVAVKTPYPAQFEKALHDHRIGLVFSSGVGDNKAYWDVQTDRGLVRAGPGDVVAMNPEGLCEVISGDVIKTPD